MRHKIKKLSLILVFIMLSIFINGCYDRREVDDMAYAVAVGFDKGKTNFFRLTLQFAQPLALAGGGGSGGSGGGGEEKGKTDTVTVESPTLYAGINMINVSLSKQVNISHAKLIVFSEELAKEGLGKYLHALIRNREFRPNINIAIARSSAENFISSVKPTLDPHPAKYFELLFNSSSYTGFSVQSQLHNFYLDTEALNTQAVTTLVEVDKFKDSNEFNNDASTYKQKGHPYPLEGDFKAGDVPKVGDVKVQAIGLAAFVGDKMIDELDGEEAAYYLMMTGEYNYSYWSIPDPKAKDNIVIINLKQSRIPKRTVEYTNGKPKIKVDVKLEADYISIQSGENYEAEHTLFEKASETFLKDGILKFLNKTAKEYKSDICGFGKGMQGKFLFWDEWEKFGWLNKYKDSTFEINVDLKMRRPGLIVRSIEPQTESR